MDQSIILKEIESGKRLLKDGEAMAALSIALELPGKCSRIEFAGDPKYQTQNDQWRDKKSYIDFCYKCLRKEDENNGFFSYLGNKYADVLYEMRCERVHAGKMLSNISGKPVSYLIGENTYSTVLSNQIFVSIPQLCEEIFAYISWWYSWLPENKVSYVQLFDVNNKEDAHEYQQQYDQQYTYGRGNYNGKHI